MFVKFFSNIFFNLSITNKISNIIPNIDISMIDKIFSNQYSSVAFFSVLQSELDKNVKNLLNEGYLTKWIRRLLSLSKVNLNQFEDEFFMPILNTFHSPGIIYCNDLGCFELVELSILLG